MDVAGLDIGKDLPEGWTPIEAFVAFKCLNEEGDVAYTGRATDSLGSMEAIGMLRSFAAVQEREIGGRWEDEDDAG